MYVAYMFLLFIMTCLSTYSIILFVLCVFTYQDYGP